MKRRDPWRAFCDGMDQVHRAQADCRGEALAIERKCRSVVAAALASSANDQDEAPAAQAALLGASGARRVL